MALPQFKDSRELNLEPVYKNISKADHSDLTPLEEGETFEEKDKKTAFKKNSLNQKLNEDLLSNKFNPEGLELV